MAPARVLKFNQSDGESSYILVQVSPKGSKPLDLKLVGTEGEAPYSCSLRHDRVVSLRVKNCPVSEDEWQSILVSIFDQDPIADIQATASVQSEDSITLTIRKQVQGITQRLGTITLNHEPDEAIELFEWCSTAVEAATRGKESATGSLSKIQQLQASVEDLKSQLDELIQAKQDDELALLQKFKDLLNEKKVKIREQQKIITDFSSSMPGPAEQPSEPEPSPKPKSNPKPASSKAPKRKAKTVEGDTADEDVDMTSVVKSESEDSDPGNTTEATASAASDEESEEAEGGDVHMNKARSQPDEESSSKKQAAPPPPRSLPFQKKKVAADTGNNQSDSDDEL